jgi:hypothetical protein
LSRASQTSPPSEIRSISHRYSSSRWPPRMLPRRSPESQSERR